MRYSLSLRERARVRGNETPPTQTAGRILQAQLDRLPESELAITSSAKPVDGRTARARKRIGVSSVASPSPHPLPEGEGQGEGERDTANPNGRPNFAGAAGPAPRVRVGYHIERKACRWRKRAQLQRSPMPDWCTGETNFHPGPLPLGGGEGESFAALECFFAILSAILRIHQ